MDLVIAHHRIMEWTDYAAKKKGFAPHPTEVAFAVILEDYRYKALFSLKEV